VYLFDGEMPKVNRCLMKGGCLEYKAWPVGPITR
jgi:hypothetical protein